MAGIGVEASRFSLPAADVVPIGREAPEDREASGESGESHEPYLTVLTATAVNRCARALVRLRPDGRSLQRLCELRAGRTIEGNSDVTVSPTREYRGQRRRP